MMLLNRAADETYSQKKNSQQRMFIKYLTKPIAGNIDKYWLLSHIRVYMGVLI